MHAQRANEITLHQPEGFRQQQRVGHFFGHAVDHFAPELDREGCFKLLFGQGMLRPAGNGAAGSGFGVPEPLVVFFSQGHGGVKADDREPPRHFQDGLNDRFAHLGIQIVELGGVIPGHAGAVVAVVDVARAAVAVVVILEYHGCVGAAVIMVFNHHAHPAVR